MKLVRNIAILLAAIHLSAYAKAQDEFIGAWSNEWAGEHFHIMIEQDGHDTFLVKIVQSENGATVLTSQGKVVDNQLVFDDGHGVSLKLAHSPSENALFLVDKPNLPIYRRVDAVETSKRDNIKQEIDKLVRPVFAAAGMACSGQKPQPGALNNALLGLPEGSSISGTYVQSVLASGTVARRADERSVIRRM